MATPDPKPENANKPIPAAEVEAQAWQDETANFKPTMEVQQDWEAERNAEQGGKPAAAAKPADPADDAAKGKAPGDAANAGADDAAAAATVGDDAAKSAAAEPDADKLPDWLTKRIARANTKESDADRRVREAEERAKTAEDEAAALKTAAAAKPALKKPDPDAFDTVQEYETARDEYETAKAAADKAPPAKVEDKKPGADDPPLPLGLTKKDLSDAKATIIEQLTPATLTGIQNAPTLTAPMMMELSSASSKEQAEELAKFIVASPKTVKAIAALPAIQQSAALVRAFNDRPKPKKLSEAPKTIERVSPAGGAQNVNLSTASFSDFEAQRNAEENKARGRAY